VFIFFGALAIARATGCSLSEAEAHSCVVAGVDIGHRLYTMAMMGWVVALLSPLLLLSLIAAAVLLGRRLLRRRDSRHDQEGIRP